MDNSTDHFADQLLERLGQMAPLHLMWEAQARSAEVGFDFAHIDSTMEKVEEETRELRESYDQRQVDPDAFEDEIGDCFFALVNLIRHAGLSLDEVLNRNARKYLRRCAHIEERLREEGKKWHELSPEEIGHKWREAKWARADSSGG